MSEVMLVGAMSPSDVWKSTKMADLSITWLGKLRYAGVRCENGVLGV
jgi:hypothetical protein